MFAMRNGWCSKHGTGRRTSKGKPDAQGGGGHKAALSPDAPLRAHRKALDLTQVQAAALMGVTEKTYRSWEKNGPSRFGMMVLEKKGWV